MELERDRDCGIDCPTLVLPIELSEIDECVRQNGSLPIGSYLNLVVLSLGSVQQLWRGRPHDYLNYLAIGNRTWRLVQMAGSVVGSLGLGIGIWTPCHPQATLDCT